MVHMLHLRMMRKVRHDLLRVLRVALQTQGQRLHALQEQEGIEGRNRRARVAQENRADVGDERRWADRVRKGHAMVARIRISNRRIMPARLPVELAGIDDNAAERRAVTADELRRGMHNDVRAVLNRANQVGRAERVVNHQRKAVPMGDFRNCVDVGNIAVRVAEGFQINRAGVALDGVLDLGEVVRIHERRGDAEMRQGMLQQVVTAAVNRLLRDDVAAILRQRLNRVVNRRRTGCQRKRRNAALQRRNALFQHILRGVGQSAVDIARICQTETCGGMGGVLKDVGRGLINRDSAGIGRRIRLFLANMQLKGFKLVIAHRDVLFSFYVDLCR